MLAKLCRQNELLDWRLPGAKERQKGHTDTIDDREHAKAGKISPDVEGLWWHSSCLSHYYLADMSRLLLHGGH